VGLYICPQYLRGEVQKTLSNLANRDIIMNLLQALLLASGTIAGSLIAALYTFQEKLLYHPNIPTRDYENKPDNFDMPFTDVDIVAEDGVRIHAWLITQSQSKDAATFLYFHGNAGNIGHR